MLVVTMNDLPGHRLNTIYGLVVGVAARPRNKFTEGVRGLEGEDVNAESHLAAGRAEAVERMVAHAKARGANAILGMSFDHRAVSENWVEICAYGTAVNADIPDTAGH